MTDGPDQDPLTLAALEEAKRLAGKPLPAKPGPRPGKFEYNGNERKVVDPDPVPDHVAKREAARLAKQEIAKDSFPAKVPAKLSKDERNYRVGKLENRARDLRLEYLLAFRGIIPPERAARIIATAADAAEFDNDDKARAFLFKYLIGEPERLLTKTPDEEVKDAESVVKDMISVATVEERNAMLKQIAEAKKRLTDGHDPAKGDPKA